MPDNSWWGARTKAGDSLSRIVLGRSLDLDLFTMEGWKADARAMLNIHKCSNRKGIHLSEIIVYYAIGVILRALDARLGYGLPEAYLHRRKQPRYDPLTYIHMYELQ